MDNEEKEVTQLCNWEFDNWSTAHWAELKEGKIDKTKSWIEYSQTDDGDRITVYTNQKPGLVLAADIDQWGTWLTFSIGESHHTIAQEHGTMSFVDAMIAALTKMKDIADCGQGKPPVFNEITKDCC